MLALVREVSPRLAECELTFLERAAIDPVRAQRQHQEYVATLRSLGCRLEWLPPLPQQPDGVFVEDTAVILPEVAVVTRPGAAARRGETDTVGTALAPHRAVVSISAPGSLEGGDVVPIGRTLHVGAAARSNAAGAAQLAAALEPLGYRVESVAFGGCLHLKSACTFIPPDVVLVNPAWVDARAFAARVVIEVAPGESYGANTLTIGTTTLVSGAFPRTRRRLEQAGITTLALDISELQKAEAALTCMSLLLPGREELPA